MRLLPTSLFGRLVLVLLGVLLAAQLIGAGILLRDRGTAIYEASGFGAAQRIAGVVQLLEALDPSQRDIVLRAVNSASFRVSYSRPPALPESTDIHAAHLRGLLHRVLGDDRPLVVAVIQTDAIGEVPEWHGRMGPMAHGPAMANFAPRVSGFLIQLRLADGQWVSFAQRLPQEQFAWPARLLLTLGILLASVILVSLIAVRWITRPLAVLGNAAQELGHDIGRPPLPEAGPREVRQAAQAFNAMQSRIRRYLHDRERLLAAVSHDLKTPITRLRLRAELLSDDALKTKFVQDLEEMESMVSATLEFMRTGYEREAVQPTDINALLESVQADREEMGQSVTIEGRAAAAYPGRPMALKRALVNLIENAIKYGSRAQIRVEDSIEQLRITIADNGPGIPEDRLEDVFEPFYRLEPSRSRKTGGVGLGLSIARDIARSHGGGLVLRNRAGGGVEAALTLPRQGR